MKLDNYTKIALGCYALMALWAYYLITTQMKWLTDQIENKFGYSQIAYNFEFFLACLPIIALGIVIGICNVRSLDRKERKGSQSKHVTAIGIGLGLLIGLGCSFFVALVGFAVNYRL